MDLTIRRARAEDVDALFALIAALADYEKLPPPDGAARARLLADGWGDRPRFEAWLALADDRAVGYAIVFETYSTFLARPTLYLEDLFVLPDHRRNGVGYALFRRLAQEAVDRGCGRMEWACLDWNRPAQEFYARIGATQLTEWLTFRLLPDRICRLPDIPCKQP